MLPNLRVIYGRIRNLVAGLALLNIAVLGLHFFAPNFYLNVFGSGARPLLIAATFVAFVPLSLYSLLIKKPFLAICFMIVLVGCLTAIR
jgi:membrane protein implicated in regulation of membrane protease activity